MTRGPKPQPYDRVLHDHLPPGVEPHPVIASIRPRARPNDRLAT